MTLGINTAMNDGEGGGEFRPQIRYGAESGRLFRIDRVQGSAGFENALTELPAGTKMIADWGSIEVGWLYFAAGQAPSMVMVPLGQPLPPRPNADHKQGFKLLMHLGRSGGIREFASSSKTVTGAVDAAHTLFEVAPEARAGKLPILEFGGGKMTQMKNVHGAKTLYVPSWTISGWVERPTDLPPRTVPPPGTSPGVMPARPVTAPMQGKVHSAASAGAVGGNGAAARAPAAPMAEPTWDNARMTPPPAGTGPGNFDNLDDEIPF